MPTPTSSSSTVLVPPIITSSTGQRSEDKRGEEGEEEGGEEDEDKRGEGSEDKGGKGEEGGKGDEGDESERDKARPKNPLKYAQTCQCEKRILNWILEDLEKEGVITMAEALPTWGTISFFLGWKFCSKHINDFANHMCLVKTNEAEKRKRLKAIYDNKDPHLLTSFVWKHLDWFEPEENLWLYGDKKGLKIDSVQLPCRKGKKK